MKSFEVSVISCAKHGKSVALKAFKEMKMLLGLEYRKLASSIFSYKNAVGQKSAKD
jgi:hypothetical protein